MKPYAFIAAITGAAALLLAGCSNSPQTGQDAGSLASTEPSKASQPNIIFILADDIGYNDLSIYGQKHFTTPNLDNMAREGIRFTDFYAGSAVCGPSRSVLMTGQHQGHTRIRANLTNITTEDGKPGFKGQSLTPEDVTVAKTLQKAGYRTGVVGKWGLGEIDDSGHPNKQGFDYFYGYLNHIHAHNHYPEFLWRNYERIDLPNEAVDVGCTYCSKFGFMGNVSTKREAYADDLIRDESLQFIDRNKDKPFFLFVSLVSPHANNEAEQVSWAHGLEVPSYGEFENKDWPEPQKGYAAMMRHIDNTVGAILKKVKAAGLDENTVVMFSGDNGPHREGGNEPTFFDSNGELRGVKRDLYEGGIRVPTIAWGPGIVPPGVVSDHPAYFGDLMATAGELSGADVPDNTDSVSFAPTLQGESDKQAQHDYIYWEFYAHGSSQAVRMGNWKGVRIPIRTGPVELYDLRSDKGETRDLSAQYPHIVKEMEKIMDENHEVSERWIPETDGVSPDRLRQRAEHTAILNTL